MTYQQENDALIRSFMDRTFYRAFKEGPDTKLENFRAIEFIINYECNLACKYCYVNRYGSDLYPSELWHDDKRIKRNTDMVLNWFLREGMDPKIEIFSGEPLVQEIAYWAVNRILDIVGHVNKGPIVIPTNYTFILSDELTKKVDDLITKGAGLGMPVSLSASVDGKYCERNRPFASNVASAEMNEKREWTWTYKDNLDPRDDAFYDKVFAFAASHGYGFHPMVYSEGIEDWQENFLWFQEMFKKHNIPWTGLYLLEIRNSEWSKTQTKAFQEFVKFLIKFSWDMVGKNRQRYMDFLFKRKGFNMLASPLTTIGRGVGCSFQSSLYLRMGDLKLAPCHRTSYDPLLLGELMIENEQITGDIATTNPELYLAGIATTQKTWPYCESCTIKSMCSGGCLGAQYETMGDMFTPIPTVCRLEHAKLIAMIEAYKEIGMYGSILGRVNEEKRATLQILDNQEVK